MVAGKVAMAGRRIWSSVVGMRRALFLAPRSGKLRGFFVRWQRSGSKPNGIAAVAGWDTIWTLPGHFIDLTRIFQKTQVPFKEGQAPRFFLARRFVPLPRRSPACRSSTAQTAAVSWAAWPLVMAAA
jgi:hypothetical protein